MKKLLLFVFILTLGCSKESHTQTAEVIPPKQECFHIVEYFPKDYMRGYVENDLGWYPVDQVSWENGIVEIKSGPFYQIEKVFIGKNLTLTRELH